MCIFIKCFKRCCVTALEAEPGLAAKAELGRSARAGAGCAEHMLACSHALNGVQRTMKHGNCTARVSHSETGLSEHLAGSVSRCTPWFFGELQ